MLYKTAIKSGVIFLAIAFASAQSIYSCSRPGDTDGEKIKAAVTILPYAYFIERIGGDRVEPVVMIPPGASPASYEPSPRQMAEMESAAVYVKVGSPLPFEKVWLEKLLGSSGKDMVLVDASEGIEIRGGDPHIWLSPRRAKIQAANMCKGLVRADPENKDFYERNRDALLSDLDKLDRDIKQELSGISNPRFMIFHPSFGYFASDYGLEQVPIEIEGKDPSPRDLARLVDEAKAMDIRVVFVAPQFRTRDAEVIAKNIGGRVEFVDPLARDYISNLRKVARALREGMAQE